MGYVVKLGGPGPDPKKEDRKPAAGTAGGGSLSQIPPRTLAIGGAVLAVLVLAGGLWFAFGRGGENAATATDIDTPGMAAPGVAGADTPPGMAGASDMQPGMAGDTAPGMPPAAAPGMDPAMAPGGGAVAPAPDFSGTPGYNPADAKDSGG